MKANILGIETRIHYSFWILVLVLTLLSIPGGIYNVASVLLLMAVLLPTVIGHEFAHALTARHFGYRTRGITLYFIGGVAEIEAGAFSNRPKEEFYIAIAGPAFNILIGLAAMMLLLLFDAPELTSENFIMWAVPAVLQILLANILFINFVLGFFNLIPAFPMDGGRILRSILLMITSREKAFAITSMASSIFGALFIAGGAYLFDPILILIGIFVFVVGRQQLR